jgi:hypothetical protein
MRKLLLLLFLVTVFTEASAQFKLGLRLAPNLAYSRVQGSGNQAGADNINPTVRFSFGGIGDFFFAENYAFSTGLWFTTKRAGVRFAQPVNNIRENTFNLQYLQIPVSMKFFTNEVAPDMRVYFQVGGTIDALINQRERDNLAENRAIDPLDIGVLLGSGIEYVLGRNTVVFGGLSYNRGLLNQANNRRLNPDVRLNMDIVAIEAGIKF